MSTEKPVLLLGDGRYERSWRDRFGKDRKRVVIVRAGRLLDLVESCWQELPSPEDGGSWEWLGELEAKHAMYGEEEVGLLAEKEDP